MDVRLDAGLYQDQRRLHVVGGYFALSFAAAGFGAVVDAGFGAVVDAGFVLFLLDVLEWWLLLAFVESCCGAWGVCGAT